MLLIVQSLGIGDVRPRTCRTVWQGKKKPANVFAGFMVFKAFAPVQRAQAAIKTIGAVEV